ncbi:MAG: response regulator [Rhodospirillaceae bacterium]|nr:MAG: response regulator [Rhodospirillaceae bacterium]
MSERILLVDDDPNLLSALQRHLRRRFDLATAQGGEEALTTVQTAMETNEPFAVVLCDMRMPGMDGIEVLKRIKERAPETVRMMLTGNADQQTATAAINEGHIFRFYTKPCPADSLAEGLNAGLEQYRLITAERDLLEKTLAGSVKVLTEVVSLNDPVAYVQACRLREWVRRLTEEFNMPRRWQLEIAAMLIPIEQVAIPPELIARKNNGEILTEEETEIFERAPETGRNLIANIPRLSAVAKIVYLQDRGYDGSGFPSDGPVGDEIPMDARLLKILKDLALAAGDRSLSSAVFAALDKRKEVYDPKLLAKVTSCLKVMADVPPSVIEVPVSRLRAGQTVLSDIRLANGRLILAANTQLSTIQIERLRNLRQIFTFRDPVKVRA